MVIFGVDTHKRDHTAVAVDEPGHEPGSDTTGTTSADHLRRIVVVGGGQLGCGLGPV
ncbi:hypothetical protein [Streptomyces griseorubiginosus]|uniref:hypothetical protein n=1 Tax=Streptomyces griseorubiginosus TaxID=67304 RepID=UPI001AD74E2F|nr:hypothetical protein [Streptomyces griseorubiginosus]